jgi:hypothetical protein
MKRRSIREILTDIDRRFDPPDSGKILLAGASSSVSSAQRAEVLVVTPTLNRLRRIHLPSHPPGVADSSLPIMPHGRSFVGGMIGCDATATLRLSAAHNPTAVDRRHMPVAEHRLHWQQALRTHWTATSVSPPSIASPASDIHVRRCERQLPSARRGLPPPARG